jgi:benzoyl-CoA reductase/2-hydroxyglutaryl-CoA dehydratase subunit BcrC/BadD/HgdB
MGHLSGAGLAARLKTRAGELAALRARGARVVAFVSGHAPHELVRAAGAVPVRLLAGGHDAETRGERWLRSDACAVCLSTIAGLAPGAPADPLYGQVDAFLSVNACDLLRRLPESVGHHHGLPVFDLYLPRSAEPLPHRLAAFRRELDRLAAELAAFAGTAFDPGRLSREIAAANRVRRRLRELDAGRRADRPAVSLSDILDLVALAGVIEPEALLATLNDRVPPSTGIAAATGRRPRLMFGGSEVTWLDRWLVELLEARADIVTDLLDTASLWFEADCPEDGDPLDALARHYYSHPAAAWRRPNDALFALARRRVTEARVDGVVLKTLLYCDPWSFESVRLKAALGRPLLHVDGTFSATGREQLRTRVEAFLEEL